VRDDERTGPDSEGVGEAADRRPRLRALLARQAAPGGFVPFDRFMEVALYGEGVGYYARARTPFGPKGDYYTAAHVHPLFGRTIARHLSAMRRALGSGRPFRVVELGPGDGTLAASVLDGLGEFSAERQGLEYVLVERSAPLRTVALERVEASARRIGIPVRVGPSLGGDGPFEGVVLANEVLDALPVRRLRWTGTDWIELGIRLSGDTISAAEAPLLGTIPSPPIPTDLEPGTTYEFSPMADGLVREVGDHLAAGAFLVLDYGMEERELLRGHPTGTLESVRRHRTVDDLYADPGSADLSTFVNFTRVRAAAQRAGLEEIAYCSQAEALGAWGFPELLNEAIARAGGAEEEVRTRLAAKSLLFGFERFRALELASTSSARALRAIT
jgi:SAM-dependent MidA family methyltransferase